MPDENAQVSEAHLGRWIVLAVFLAACVGAYFAFAPRVPPAIVPYVTGNP